MTRSTIVNATGVTDLGAYSFKEIRLGDSFTTKGLFSGVATDELHWKLTECNFSLTDLVFTVSYMGISLGEYRINLSANNEVTRL